MFPKRSFPAPTPGPTRVLAAHVQAAVHATAQPRMSVVALPPRPVAPHVQNALSQAAQAHLLPTAQAKASGTGRPVAAHVQNALAQVAQAYLLPAVPAKGPATTPHLSPAVVRPVAAHVQSALTKSSSGSVQAMPKRNGNAREEEEYERIRREADDERLAFYADQDAYDAEVKQAEESDKLWNEFDPYEQSEVRGSAGRTPNSSGSSGGGSSKDGGSAAAAAETTGGKSGKDGGGSSGGTQKESAWKTRSPSIKSTVPTLGEVAKTLVARIESNKTKYTMEDRVVAVIADENGSMVGPGFSGGWTSQNDAVAALDGLKRKSDSLAKQIKATEFDPPSGRYGSACAEPKCLVIHKNTLNNTMKYSFAFYWKGDELVPKPACNGCRDLLKKNGNLIDLAPYLKSSTATAAADTKTTTAASASSSAAATSSSSTGGSSGLSWPQAQGGGGGSYASS